MSDLIIARVSFYVKYVKTLVTIDNYYIFWITDISQKKWIANVTNCYLYLGWKLYDKKMISKINSRMWEKFHFTWLNVQIYFLTLFFYIINECTRYRTNIDNAKMYIHTWLQASRYTNNITRCDPLSHFFRRSQKTPVIYFAWIIMLY